VLPEAKRASLRDNRALEITPASLRSILKLGRQRRLDVIRLDEVRNRLGSPRGRKFVCFTFDDGYRDNLEEALPIFREYSFPFVVNVTTGFINRTASAWWYTLEDILRNQPTVQITWEGEVLRWTTNSPETRDAAFAELASLIRAQCPAARESLIAELCDTSGIDPCSGLVTS
jgi:peptidoglycan/xylan/chitin deacetylase (PgdA/CDA1 family)